MKTKHWIVFILLGLIWSSSFLWIKIAVSEVGPLTLVAWRLLFGLLFGLTVILFQRPAWPTGRQWAPVLLLGVTNVAIPFFLISWGEQSIDSGVAAILDSTVPLFTIVIAHYLLHDDKMTTAKVAGLLMGFGGVIILTSKDIGGSPSSLLGQGAVVLACAFYAGSNVFARKFTQDVPGAYRSVGPLISSTAVIWVSAAAFEAPFKVPQIPVTWVALVWLGVLGSGLAFIMNYYLLHEIGPTRTTMVTYLFPVGGLLLGMLFLHEEPTWQALTGAALILASLVVANWEPKKA